MNLLEAGIQLMAIRKQIIVQTLQRSMPTRFNTWTLQNMMGIFIVKVILVKTKIQIQ